MPPLFAIWEESTNWGDASNKVLIETLSRREVVNVSPYLNRYKMLCSYSKNLFRMMLGKPIYMAVGSILAWADRDTIVWGSGFISSGERLRERPRKIAAIRGALSREIVLSQGFNCPAVYGDPALLFSRLFPRKPSHKYPLGIIPHFVDYERAKRIFGSSEGVRVIDIKSGIFSVVDQVLECERVAASCLHGLVLADSYGIPSLWLRMSNRVIGGGFKFRDYYSSMNRGDVEAFDVTEDTRVKDVLGAFSNYRVDVGLYDALLEACPFKREKWVR